MQLLHGLGHEVGGGVADQVEPVRAIRGKRLKLAVRWQRCEKIKDLLTTTNSDRLGNRLAAPSAAFESLASSFPGTCRNQHTLILLRRHFSHGALSGE